MRAVHDHRTRRRRHADLARTVVVWGRLARLRCPSCGVRARAVAFTRPGSRFTRSFEDGCLWLARAAPQIVVPA